MGHEQIPPEAFPEYGLTDWEAAELEKSDGQPGSVLTAYTPVQAGQFLRRLSYGPSIWHDIVSERLISHDVQAMAVIALGYHTRVQYIVLKNLMALEHLEEGSEVVSDPGIRDILKNPDKQMPALKEALA